MKRELKYFEIDGAFGGNQEWFSNVVMYMGGCAAATACDSCIYFAKYMGLTELYPFDMNDLNKEEYKKFSQIMKPYIKPRVGGVKKLSWFIEGFKSYIADVNKKQKDPKETLETEIRIDMEEFSGERTAEEAEILVRRQIDNDIPIPCLLLHHKDKEQFKDFIWHWFLIVGYEETEEDFKIKTATYGEAAEFSLKEMWDTGFEEKGGFILYEPANIRYNKEQLVKSSMKREVQMNGKSNCYI